MITFSLIKSQNINSIFQISKLLLLKIIKFLSLKLFTDKIVKL